MGKFGMQEKLQHSKKISGNLKNVIDVHENFQILL
jgi:hypothetical protein